MCDEYLKYLAAEAAELKKHVHEKEQRRKTSRCDVCATGLHENDSCCPWTGYYCAIQICGVSSDCLHGIQDIASFRLLYGFLSVIQLQEPYRDEILGELSVQRRLNSCGQERLGHYCWQGGR